MISAFLDTNVLLGITETDLLLSLSETGGMLRPYWSEYVFEVVAHRTPQGRPVSNRSSLYADTSPSDVDNIHDAKRLQNRNHPYSRWSFHVRQD